MRLFAFIKWLIAAIPIKIGFDVYVNQIIEAYVDAFKEFIKEAPKKGDDKKTVEIWKENIRNLDKFKTKYGSKWDGMAYSIAKYKANLGDLMMEEGMNYAKDQIAEEWLTKGKNWPFHIKRDNPEILDMNHFKNLIMRIFENNLIDWLRTKGGRHGERFIKQVPYGEEKEFFEKSVTETYDTEMVKKFKECVSDIQHYLGSVSGDFPFDKMFEIIQDKVNFRAWTKSHQRELERRRERVEDRLKKDPDWEKSEIIKIMQEEEKRQLKSKMSSWRRAYLSTRSKMKKEFGFTTSKLDRAYDELTNHLKDFFQKYQKCGISPETFVYNIASEEQRDTWFRFLLASWVLGETIADEINSNDYVSPADFVKELKSRRQKKTYSGDCIADRIVASYLQFLP